MPEQARTVTRQYTYTDLHKQ